MIYNNPLAYKVDLKPEGFLGLVECENIVAIKESSHDSRRMTDSWNVLGDRFLMFCGVDDLIFENVLCGAVGWVSGMVNSFPAEAVRLLELTRAGRIEEARALYRWFMPLLHLDVHKKLVQYIKLTNQLTGMGAEWVRGPRLPLVGEERARIEAIVRRRSGDPAESWADAVPILLGAIADDFTGATDLCSMLVRNGMRTVQLIGVPEPGLAVPDADAVVVALKSRTAPVAEAVAQSLAAQRWLAGQGARQYLFKYCSTFDSTAEGNIGPVADALLDALGTGFTVVCPAFPETGRTIFKGHLFVGDLLLSDTHMRTHPLTPMTDASLVRVLQAQTSRKVGLVSFDVVRLGPDAIRARFAELQAAGCAYAVTDAIEDEDLRRLGTACRDLALITGGSGIAMGLPENFRRTGLLTSGEAADTLPAVAGGEVVLAGSCSAATLGQIAAMAALRPALRIDPVRLAEGWDPAEDGRLGDRPHARWASARLCEWHPRRGRCGASQARP